MDGAGRGNKLADDVVEIIRSRGGVAVANYGESVPPFCYCYNSALFNR